MTYKVFGGTLSITQSKHPVAHLLLAKYVSIMDDHTFSTSLSMNWLLTGSG